MKLKPKQIIKPTLCLFIICVVITAVLAFVNLVTSDTIKTQEDKKQSDSCKIVLPNAQEFKEVEDNEKYYIGLDQNGKTIGYVFNTKAKGYGGDINILTGINTDAKISGVVVLSHNETPGLGSNAAKKSFTGQYEQLIPKDSFKVVKSAAKEGEIQAVTGATISSTAVTSAVNEAVKKFSEINS